MSTLTQPLSQFIREQVNLGVVHSEMEAEQVIMMEMEERKFNRKLLKSQQQIKEGNYVELNDEFLVSFLKEARIKYAQ